MSKYELYSQNNRTFAYRKLLIAKNMEKVTIVKVGGAIVEDSEQLAQLLKDFAAIPGKKVLVHGGGRRATKVAAALGIESKMVNGRRITRCRYAGGGNNGLWRCWSTRTWLPSFQANGVNALGLTGADMDVIHSHKRRLKDGIDFGFVGDVERANGKMLQTLINEGITPVMAPLTHDGKGNILNTNADTIASETAKALAPYYDVTLIYSFEKKGVLSNPEDDDSVIPVITHADFERYKADGTVAGGMIPKLENALAAIDAGVKEVIITLATAIDGKHGTMIK